MYKIIGADLKEYGPITADQLRQWISEGRVNGDTKVQTEGSTDWKRMSELPEFRSVLPAAPPSPPMPPLGTVPPPAPAPMPIPHPGPTLAPGMPQPVSMPPSSKSNQMAVWALVTGILSVLCCQVLAPVSIVLGAVALSQIKQRPEQEGSGFAIAGIVLGIIALLLMVVGAVVFFSTPGILNNLQNSLNQ